jgi:stringent starvation protein B
MTSSRPYLIRALYEWITDNGLTPYILVDAEAEGLHAPLEYADNGKLVLNIAPRAVRDFFVDNEHISFSARFGGHARDVFVPVRAVLAIYARENGQGMLFNEREEGDATPPPPSDGPQGKGSGRPVLRVVK